jgi:hypothetical protein
MCIFRINKIILKNYFQVIDYFRIFAHKLEKNVHEFICQKQLQRRVSC